MVSSFTRIQYIWYEKHNIFSSETELKTIMAPVAPSNMFCSLYLGALSPTDNTHRQTESVRDGEGMVEGERGRCLRAYICGSTCVLMGGCMLNGLK